MTSLSDGTTPVWCKRCEMWVPLEREPHVGLDDDGEQTPIHYAADYAGLRESDDDA